MLLIQFLRIKCFEKSIQVFLCFSRNFLQLVTKKYKDILELYSCFHKVANSVTASHSMCLSEASVRLTLLIFAPRSLCVLQSLSHTCRQCILSRGVWNPFLRAGGWNFCVKELCEAVIDRISVVLLLQPLFVYQAKGFTLVQQMGGRHISALEQHQAMSWF